MARYLRYFLHGYEHMDAAGAMTDVCQIDLIAESEKDAVARARQLVKRPKYRVYNVVEFDPELEHK